MKNPDPAHIEMQTVFTLNGVMYIPHYMYPGKFVKPGYKTNDKTFGPSELIAHGAVETKHPLWLRAA